MCVQNIEKALEKPTFVPQVPLVEKAQRQTIIRLRWFFGLFFTINFLVFWALPVGIQVRERQNPPKHSNAVG
jgi:hypothetical protein